MRRGIIFTTGLGLALLLSACGGPFTANRQDIQHVGMCYERTQGAVGDEIAQLVEVYAVVKNVGSEVFRQPIRAQVGVSTRDGEVTTRDHTVSANLLQPGDTERIGPVTTGWTPFRLYSGFDALIVVSDDNPNNDDFVRVIGKSWLEAAFPLDYDPVSRSVPGSALERDRARHACPLFGGRDVR